VVCDSIGCGVILLFNLNSVEGIKDVGELMLASFPVDPSFVNYISKENPW
jgi:hypothetical protein